MQIGLESSINQVTSVLVMAIKAWWLPEGGGGMCL